MVSEAQATKRYIMRRHMQGRQGLIYAGSLKLVLYSKSKWKPLKYLRQESEMLRSVYHSDDSM